MAEQAEKDLLTTDLTMDFLLEHERVNQIRNISIQEYSKIGDYVVSFFFFDTSVSVLEQTGDEEVFRLIMREGLLKYFG